LDAQLTGDHSAALAVGRLNRVLEMAMRQPKPNANEALKQSWWNSGLA